MISQLRPALTMVGAFAVLLGLGYPLAMTGIAQMMMPAQANGSLIRQDGQVIGSALIGQDFTRPQYIHPRPTATDPPYNAASSTGSNLGPGSAVLIGQARGHAAALGGSGPVPSGMVTASASGLDPHIPLKGAMDQVPRIAAARAIAPGAVEKAIRSAATGPAFGFVGTPIVNVLRANMALDAQSGAPAP